MLVTKFQSQNHSHKIWSLNCSHKIYVTKLQSQHFCDLILVTKFQFAKFQSQKFSHKILVTKFRSHNFSHTIFCHHCHYCHYCHYCRKCHYFQYCLIGRQEGSVSLPFDTLKLTFSQTSVDGRTYRRTNGPTNQQPYFYSCSGQLKIFDKVQKWKYLGPLETPRTNLSPRYPLPLKIIH